MKTRQKIRLILLLISFMLFPVTIYYFSPILSIGGAFGGVLSGSIIVFASMFLVSLFLGRSFCGWLCPAGGLQEITSLFRTKPVKRRKINWIKYLIWVPWLSGIFLFIKRADGDLEVNFFYQTTYGFSVADVQGLFVYIIVIMTFFLLSLIIGKRSACHTICWMSPFMIIGRFLSRTLRLPSLKLKLSESPCISCSKCTKSCPMSIDVMNMVHTAKMENSDCIQCGSCVDNCPKKTIMYSFGSI